MKDNTRFVMTIESKSAEGFYTGRVRTSHNGTWVYTCYALTMWGLKRELRKWLKDEQPSEIIGHATVDSNNNITINKRKETK